MKNRFRFCKNCKIRIEFSEGEQIQVCPSCGSRFKATNVQDKNKTWRSKFLNFKKQRAENEKKY